MEREEFEERKRQLSESLAIAVAGRKGAFIISSLIRVDPTEQVIEDLLIFLRIVMENKAERGWVREDFRYRSEKNF